MRHTMLSRRPNKVGVIGVGVMLSRRRLSKAGVLGVGAVAMQNLQAEQGFGAWGWGGREGRSYYSPQSQQSLQPPQSQPGPRGLVVRSRSNADNPRKRPQQTPDRLWNGRLN